MYYHVGWMLSGWIGYSEYIVELSDQECQDLLERLRKLKGEGKIYGWRLAPAVVLDSKSIADNLASDLREEKRA